MQTIPQPAASRSSRRGRTSRRFGVHHAVGILLSLCLWACDEDVRPSSGGGGSGAGTSCSRELLGSTVDAYFKALAAHNPSSLKLAPNVKFTENGKELPLGEGLWKTAGAVKFKRSALDVQQCESATESVVPNGRADFIVGLRLKLQNQLISEVETYLVGPNGWFPNPAAVIRGASDDWETPLPANQRATRDELKKIVDDYFIGLFGGTVPVARYPFASNCKRAENGFSPGACNFGIPTIMAMRPVHYVLDVEASIGVGFVLFAGAMLDFHMFKVRGGQVQGVHAVVGPSVGRAGRGWP